MRSTKRRREPEVSHPPKKRKISVVSEKEIVENLLVEAVKNDDIRSVRDCIENRNADPQRVLNLAVRTGNVEIISLLIEKGADVNKRVEGAVSRQDYAIECAAAYGYVDVVELLIQNGSILFTALHHACRQNDKNPESRYLDTINTLIENGVDVNYVNSRLRTPLHDAVVHGHVDTVNILINNGADLCAKDGTGWNAIHELTRCPDTDAVDMANILLKNKNIAAMDARNLFGMTPFLIACSQQKQNIARLLMLHGANVNAEAHFTALGYAWGNLVNHADHSTASEKQKHLERLPFVRDLVCYGVKIDAYSMERDINGFLWLVHLAMEKLRRSERLGNNDVLISPSERKWQNHVAVAIALRVPQVAFKMWCIVRSFTTFHGIFMVRGYGSPSGQIDLSWLKVRLRCYNAGAVDYWERKSHLPFLHLVG